jgi:hypothetical protein
VPQSLTAAHIQQAAEAAEAKIRKGRRVSTLRPFLVGVEQAGRKSAVPAFGVSSED